MHHSVYNTRPKGLCCSCTTTRLCAPCFFIFFWLSACTSLLIANAFLRSAGVLHMGMYFLSNVAQQMRVTLSALSVRLRLSARTEKLRTGHVRSRRAFLEARNLFPRFLGLPLFFCTIAIRDPKKKWRKKQKREEKNDDVQKIICRVAISSTRKT